MLCVSGCASVRQRCDRAAATSIARLSGGSVPALMGRIDIHDDGCLSYSFERFSKCLCNPPTALKDVLAPEVVGRVVHAMRIAPRTHFDVTELAVRHEGVDAGVAIEDLPAEVVQWLASVDETMAVAVGPKYRALGHTP